MNTDLYNQQTDTPVWGFVTTFLWGFGVAVVFVMTQIMAVWVYSFLFADKINRMGYDQFMNNISAQGDVLSVSTISTCVICTALLLGIIKMKRGAQIEAYLPVKKIRVKRILVWVLLVSGYIVFADHLSLSLGRPLVPPFMTDVYTSADEKGVLIIALIGAAPLFEEAFFRGFMFKGIQSSLFGSLGAVILTAGLWSLIHTQYDFYDLTQILIMGLILGSARWKEKSLLAPFILHAFINSVGLLQTIYILS